MKVFYYCPGCRRRVVREVINRRKRHLMSFCGERGKKYRMKLMVGAVQDVDIVTAYAAFDHRPLGQSQIARLATYQRSYP